MTDHLRGHSFVGTRTSATGAVRFARCSCGQEFDGPRCRAELAAHLTDCPDEADALEVSDETEAWVADRYDDTTLTLDEWKAKYR